MITVLRPIKEAREDWDALEKEIRDLYKKLIYIPLMKEMQAPAKALTNSKPGLTEALRTGEVTFHRGTFSGKFNSVISKELQALGARFDRSQGTYKIPYADLPVPIKGAVSSSEHRFRKKLEAIDRRLSEIVPEEFAALLNPSKHFASALGKTEKDFQSSVKGITIAPKLTDYQKKKIADQWSNNMQLWVKEFTEKEIKMLRTQVATSALAGDRYGAAVKTIQDSYGVTERKAKFLARQETSLMMTSFKQSRYQEAGVHWYKWGCVSGSSAHPVRPDHKKNEGKIFSWDKPPTVNSQGDRENPGQDYNCRCFAKPLVGYKPGQSR